jgi:hypothetical protein
MPGLRDSRAASNRFSTFSVVAGVPLRRTEVTTSTAVGGAMDHPALPPVDAYDSYRTPIGCRCASCPCRGGLPRCSLATWTQR